MAMERMRTAMVRDLAGLRGGVSLLLRFRGREGVPFFAMMALEGGW